jgi:hypothetical protein
MSNNKRAPKELSKYVVHVIEKVNKGEGIKEKFQYFQTQREAKEWARGQMGKKRLFKIIYDSFGEI